MVNSCFEMKENAIKNKSFAFAIQIVRLYKHLVEAREYVLSKQLLRSGTSIGAMIREAQHAESTADFRHKLAIAQKETGESLYWLELLWKTDYLTDAEFRSINDDAIEIIKLLKSNPSTSLIIMN